MTGGFSHARLSLMTTATPLADSKHPEIWKSARVGRVGASDAAGYAKLESVPLYIAAKLKPSWEGSAYSDWGNEREPIILADHGYEQNTIMFASADNDRFVATPDGIKGNRLAQVKTTVKDFRSKRTNEIMVPPNYYRQVQWEMMVMGEAFIETDFIFEKHQEINGQFVPEFESTVVKIARDADAIGKLVQIAELVLHGLDLAVF